MEERNDPITVKNSVAMMCTNLNSGWFNCEVTILKTELSPRFPYHSVQNTKHWNDLLSPCGDKRKWENMENIHINLSGSPVRMKKVHVLGK